jgi:hypothetical protein
LDTYCQLTIQAKHALKAVLDDYFPDPKGIFWSIKSKGLKVGRKIISKKGRWMLRSVPVF